MEDVPRALYRSVRALPVLGVSGAVKRLLSLFTPFSYRIVPRGYRYPVTVRGRTSDSVLIYTIFALREYPAPNDPVSFIIDAGANVGYSAIYFARNYPKATVIAIEPETSNYEMLVKNTHNYPNIVPVNAALWPRKEPVYLVDPKVDKWRIQCASTPNGPAIDTCTINQIVHEYGARVIDILKIDIEGAEKELFRENTEWLGMVRRMFIEIHAGCWKPVFDALAPHQYDCRRRGENILVAFGPLPERGKQPAYNSKISGEITAFPLSDNEI